MIACIDQDVLPAAGHDEVARLRLRQRRHLRAELRLARDEPGNVDAEVLVDALHQARAVQAARRRPAEDVRHAEVLLRVGHHVGAGHRAAAEQPARVGRARRGAGACRRARAERLRKCIREVGSRGRVRCRRRRPVVRAAGLSSCTSVDWICAILLSASVIVILRFLPVRAPRRRSLLRRGRPVPPEVARHDLRAVPALELLEARRSAPSPP